MLKLYFQVASWESKIYKQKKKIINSSSKTRGARETSQMPHVKK